MSLSISVSVSKEGKFYVARAIEIELTSQGKTFEEALANFKEAFQLWAKHAEQDELDILNRKEAPVLTQVAIPA